MQLTDVCDERRSLSAIIARLEMSVDVTPSFLDDCLEDDNAVVDLLFTADAVVLIVRFLDEDDSIITPLLLSLLIVFDGII